jgi:signal transduction histidine kinase
MTGMSVSGMTGMGRWAGWTTQLGGRWQRLSLATQFAMAGSLVLALAALAIGWWVTGRIEASVVRNTANASAIYMDSFISPLSQNLATEAELSPGAHRALDEIFTNTPLGERIVSFKIWDLQGKVLDARDPAIVGQKFAIADDLQAAMDGHVSASFVPLVEAENAAEAALGLPLLEIYSPIRQDWSGKVIAVAEFYERNDQLRDDLIAARWGAWATVGGIVLGLGSLLYFIVLGGSRLIDSQRRTLDARLSELRVLSSHNTDLRLRVQGAAARAAAQTEQSMRRIGADLHDGPAQYLAYAALRLDALRDRVTDPSAQTDVESVASAVTHAMTEVRALARGLSLPEIADHSIKDIIRRAAEAHAIRAGSPVVVHLQCDPEPDLPPAARICIFRFVQEGLNNASRHGGGVGMKVDLTSHPGTLTLTIRDTGPGLGPMTPPSEGRGLGLQGLRDRVESLGGIFTARTHPKGGTEVQMTLETGAF